MKHSSLALSLLALCVSQAVSATMTQTDIKREEIIIFSRQGEAQLNQAIPQLQKLYQQTHDSKVRDDLITLLVRQSRFQEAVDVCASCANSHFSENELENLAKAYRMVKNPQKSLALYSLLAQKQPNNPNGLLGKGLVETELGEYAKAKQALNQYRTKFGADDAFKEANSYLLNKTEPDVAKLGRWQDELKENPKNTRLALDLYRLSAKLSVRPLQDKLVATYPELFSEKDKRWLAHDEIITSIRGNTSLKNAELEQAYQQLSDLMAQTDSQNPLYIQALSDRIAVANRLNDNKKVMADYRHLTELNQPIPAYVQEAYGDTLLRQGSPHQALAVYQEMEADARKASPTKEVRSALLFKLVAASSDAGLFKQAQHYQDQIKEPPQIWDFTKTTRLANPNYDRSFYNQVNLHNWRGNKTQAFSLLENRLTNITPGEPWAMLAYSELEASRHRYDDAVEMAEKAKFYLKEEEQIFYRNQLGSIALAQGNYAYVKKLVNSYSEKDKEDSASFLKQYQEARRGRFTASLGIFHPKDVLPAKTASNELTQEYYLYSPMTEDGHYLYAHQFEARVPTDSETLRLQRFGLGAHANFYPFNLGMELGSGTRLNKKSYASFNIDYLLNQYWQFSAAANINSQSTPIKAIRQGVYANDYGFSTAYTFSNRFQVGAGVSQMKLDDGNTRKMANVWLNVETYKHDRWTLNNGVRYDFQRNQFTPSAYYYNPAKTQSLEFSSDLSYYQPFDYGVTLTHHLRGNVGRNKQLEQTNVTNNWCNQNWCERKNSATTWAVSYGHDWKLNKKISLSYEIGRKKNMYDGVSEMNNYGNVNLSVSF